jgi:NhaP-type Na+/H+ and K+/H+ antiporter
MVSDSNNRRLLDRNTALFAVAAVLIRPLAFFLALSRSKLDRRSRLLIAWFGPRALSSLLLVLVPVFAGVPGTEPLFDICCLVVLLSVALHGGSLMLLGREGALPHERISVEELAAPRASDTRLRILDVRSDTSFASSESLAAGALRVSADQAVQRMTELAVPHDSWIVAFCA